MLLRVCFNYVIYICICVGPQRNHYLTTALTEWLFPMWYHTERRSYRMYRTLYRAIQQKGIIYYWCLTWRKTHYIKLVLVEVFCFGGEITSDLLFSLFFPGSSMIATFSFKQRLHFFKVGLTALYCPLIPHASLRPAVFVLRFSIL